MGIFSKPKGLIDLDTGKRESRSVGDYIWLDDFTWIEVAGSIHHQDTLKPLLGKYEGLKFINCEVVREPSNKFNPRAISILVKGQLTDSWHQLFDFIDEPNARLVGSLNVHNWDGKAMAKAKIQVDRELMKKKTPKK
jgi:hypothetical protein